MAATIPNAPIIGWPFVNAHAVKPNDSAVSSVTKIKWKAFNDILVQLRSRRKIVHRVKRQRDAETGMQVGEEIHLKGQQFERQAEAVSEHADRKPE